MRSTEAGPTSGVQGCHQSTPPTAAIAIALIAVTASQNGSAQADVDPQGQSRYERITDPWADDYHGGRFRPPTEG